MLLAHRSLMCPQQPPLSEAKPRRCTRGISLCAGFVAWAENGDLVSVALLGDVVVAFPSIRVNHRPRGRTDSSMHGCRLWLRGVGHPSQPDAADSSPVLLGRDDNDRLIFGLSAADAFFLSTDVGFIHLHTAVAADPGRAGPWHAAACGANSKLSGSCPGRAPVEAPTHSLRISGWSGTTWPETTLAGAFASVQKSSPPSREVRRRHFLHFRWPVFVIPGLAADTLRASEALPPPNPPPDTPDTPLPTQNQSSNSGRVLG